MQNITRIPEITDGEFGTISRLVRDRSWYELERKSYLMGQSKLLLPLFQERGFQNWSMFYAHLVVDARFRQRFLDIAVNDETFFFRFYIDFDNFGELLPGLFQEAKKFGRRPRFCYIGCAGAPEPSSGVMVADSIHIPIEKAYAFDLNDVDIEKAKSARGFQREIERTYSEPDMPDRYKRMLRRYTSSDGTILKRIADQVHFEQQNLVDLIDEERTDVFIPQDRLPFDVVFCRNLITHEREEAGRKVLEFIKGILRNGGYLFLGIAPSGSYATEYFKPVGIKKALYVNP